MNKNIDLFKKVNVEKLTAAGQKVYEKIKGQYEPKHNGKFIAIEPESGDIFMGNDAADALVKAEKKYPDKLFYVVKIGFTAAETIANSYFK